MSHTDSKPIAHQAQWGLRLFRFGSWKIHHWQRRTKNLQNLPWSVRSSGFLFGKKQLEYEGEIAFLELMEQHLEASEDVELTRLPFEEELWKKNKESRTSGSARALVNLCVRYVLLWFPHYITITITSAVLKAKATSSLMQHLDQRH